MSIYMTVYKCIGMHEYMYVCMYVCMYVLYAYIRVCIHLCIYVIFKLGFERYGGNCPSWEWELSGGNCPGELSGGCPFPGVFRSSRRENSTYICWFIVLYFCC